MTIELTSEEKKFHEETFQYHENLSELLNSFMSNSELSDDFKFQLLGSFAINILATAYRMFTDEGIERIINAAKKKSGEELNYVQRY